jgi:hypothetical protein
MNRLPLACALAALLLAPTFARADDITYTVDLNFSGESNSLPNVPATLAVTGTITTDGNQGHLNSGDVLSFDLDITETAGTTASAEYTPPDTALTAFANSLSATPEGLFYTGNGQLVFRQDSTSIEFYLVAGNPGAVIYTGPIGFTDDRSGVLQIAPAPTPEPSSLILLGTGALGLASTLRRRLAS